jgi:hypothetical protein
MKNKNRAIRRQKSLNYIKKQLKIASLNGQEPFKPFGYFKKRAAMDCGKPKCGLCGNPRKSLKGRNNTTLQEKKSLITYKEHC